MKTIALFLLFTINVSAIAAGKSCSKLESCVQLVSNITGEKYTYNNELKGAVKLTKNFKINKKNADDFISEILYLNGFARIKNGEDSWSIINARDIRYSPTPLFEYGKDEIPENNDYALVSIKLKNPYIVSEVSRNFRPFMSRYGRIIDIRDPGVIVINDTGSNIHRLISLIKIIDKAPTKDDIKKYEERERKRIERSESIKKAKEDEND